VTLGEDFAAVLDAARRGDEAAIGRLYGDVNARLVAFLRSRAPLVADDLASEVWLAAARGLPRFIGDESGWYGFLFTIARRQVADHWRQTKRRRTDPVDPVSLAEHEAATNVESDGIGSTVGREVIELIHRHLTADQADVVLLRVVAGLDVDEVAAVLGKEPGAIRVLQHRGLKRLALRLSGLAVTP
jgi:RNA polymerase sigma-70 factor (ECF subfamily)